MGSHGFSASRLWPRRKMGVVPLSYGLEGRPLDVDHELACERATTNRLNAGDADFVPLTGGGGDSPLRPLVHRSDEWYKGIPTSVLQFAAGASEFWIFWRECGDRDTRKGQEGGKFSLFSSSCR